MCRSVAEIHVERTQAAVEQPDTLLVRNPLRMQHYDAIHYNCLVFLPLFESGKYRLDRKQGERKKGNRLLICLKLRSRLLYAIQGLPA